MVATGSDCIGTSHRQGAASVLQLELMPKPPKTRTDKDPWPNWPMTLRTSSSHEEGGERQWSVLTKEFINDDSGNVNHIKLVDIEWDEKQKMQEIEGTERLIPCELALLAIGFKQPENSLLESLGVDQTAAGTVKADSYQTSDSQVFAAGDARRGQSIVVWAISEGREAARELDRYLMGKTDLPSKKDSYMNLDYA